MPIAYFEGWYSPELVERNPDVIFVFGDNVRRKGMGGQAIIRGLPNVAGVATKRVGDMARGSFFEEDNQDDREAVIADLDNLKLLLEAGHKLVVPVSRQSETISLGLERAQLTSRAPSLYKLICETIEGFVAEYGSWDLGNLA